MNTVTASGLNEIFVVMRMRRLQNRRQFKVRTDLQTFSVRAISNSIANERGEFLRQIQFLQLSKNSR